MTKELTEMIEALRFKHPETEGEIFYNMAIKHVMNQIKIYEKYNQPLGKNDYQE